MNVSGNYTDVNKRIIWLPSLFHVNPRLPNVTSWVPKLLCKVGNTARPE